ncbi:MAG: hypothetical protein ACI93R_001621 [Flavobacteriales bacterium]|jgi:hypothetical protein
MGLIMNRKVGAGKLSVSLYFGGVMLLNLLMNINLFADENVETSGSVIFSPLDDDAVNAYERTPSLRHDSFQSYKDNPSGPYSPFDIFSMPMKSRGTPGVCLLDYDKDGDVDIYVTNGPGTANTLLENQLVESGVFEFIDRAKSSNVTATGQDSSGCVYGDIDNDGDHDLYVLGAGVENILFENNGDGTFTDISAASNSNGDGQWSISASMGDINNDGLLDIFVGNAFDLNNRLPIAVVPFELNQHNQLFLNLGNNKFVDVSQASGITELNGMKILTDTGVEPVPGTPATITWAVAMVDIDLDGNIDLFQADDQAAILSISEAPANANLNRGMVHLFSNDGTGQFVDSMQSSVGGWMGLSFGDFDSDGNMDYFASNFGDVNSSVIFEAVLGLPPETALGTNSSRWFFGGDDGTFVDARTLGDPPPQLPDTISSAFGWGNIAVDYDNDADTDIMYVGGIQGPFIFADNPLAILQNNGHGRFTRDSTALSQEDSLRHLLSIEEGMAAGDLNNDGFVDVVSVATFSLPNPVPEPPAVLPNPFRNLFGGAFGEEALISPVFAATETPEQFSFLPGFLDFPNGKLSVEINSADNDNNWISIELVGAKGLTKRGSVNRDGIGAVVTFRPRNGKAVMQPILGGSSFQSQSSLVAHFGLGQERIGTIDVLWPGGLRNRFVNARARKHIVFPEIACNPSIYWPKKSNFKRCVLRQLNHLVYMGVIDNRDKGNFMSGMVSLFNQEVLH